jgi:putative GTP pyrophosphokinase
MALIKGDSNIIERVILSQLDNKNVMNIVDERTLPYRELMTYYRCALMEVETKFKVLNEALSVQYDTNPIESIKTRIKSPESILEKLNRKGYPLSVESIEENLNDIAGVRVICSHPQEIYDLAEAFLNQDDIQLIKKKDYIKNPKENGYRSLHLIVGVPIFLHDNKRVMKVEVQFRTISMDFWASLEHKIKYKKDLPQMSFIERELKECADMSAELDMRMQKLQMIANNIKTK